MIRVSAYNRNEKIIGAMFETVEEAIIYSKGLRDGYRTAGADMDFVHSADVMNAIENSRYYVNAGDPYLIFIYDADTFFQDPIDFEI